MRPLKKLCRQTNDSQYHREQRANETIIEQNNRLNNNAQRKRYRRANETPKQRERRWMRMERLGLINDRRRERPRQVVVDTDGQGQLELYCEFCGALYWTRSRFRWLLFKMLPTE